MYICLGTTFSIALAAKCIKMKLTNYLICLSITLTCMPFSYSCSIIYEIKLTKLYKLDKTLASHLSALNRKNAKKAKQIVSSTYRNDIFKNLMNKCFVLVTVHFLLFLILYNQHIILNITKDSI